MNYKLSYLKDVLGNNYIGIKYNEADVEGFLMQLIDHVGSDKFETLTLNQQKRDKGFHTTVLSVMEYNRAIKDLGMDLFLKKLGGAFSLDINDIEMLGVGTTERNGNVTYYVVVKSDMLDEVRNSLGFGNKDLHITIGFDKKDVFGRCKDETTLI
ncbi:MAG: putative RNA 2',3'-cyclic phosphodiesterase [uncultured marine phage]|uniref:Putative RNA 2',3'-cyclic phosphodiesterase n=1 Tax=uncultured marine phage TaxID=707152 RepID=A0A8D9FS47_9VIRU|nr:MAG: putative RNA 2',3'-cyclic phosphodiesterase [uncultured marine phage]